MAELREMARMLTPCRNLNTIRVEVEDDFTTLFLPAPAPKRGSNIKIPILEQLFRILLACVPVKICIFDLRFAGSFKLANLRHGDKRASPQMPRRSPGLVVGLRKSCSASTSSPPELRLGPQYRRAALS
jgi:hypothetical protein